MSTNATPARYVSIGDVITIGTTYVGTGDEKTAAGLNALLDRALAAEAGTDRWKEEALRLRVDIAAIELRSDVISMRGTTSRLASAEAKLAESALLENRESSAQSGITDTMRLDWLTKNGETMTAHNPTYKMAISVAISRAAIDAAMRQEGGVR